MNIRTVLALFIFVISSFEVYAQSWPNRPVRVVVPAPAGSNPDVTARIFAQELEKILGQAFIVENKPGAGGIIGADAVAKAAPDGYTILLGSNQLTTINPYLYKSLPYAVTDFAPVTILISGNFAVIANKNLAANNIPELIALAKREPGKLNYASIGPGTVMHLGMLLLEAKSGIKLTHIPYKQLYTSDLISGAIDIALEPMGTAMTLTKSGKAKVLGVTGPSPNTDVWPDVKTVNQAAPGVVIVGWLGMWLPSKTPEVIVRRLEEAISRVVHIPTVVNRIRESGFEPVGTGRDEMKQTSQAMSQMWGGLIRSNNLSIE